MNFAQFDALAVARRRLRAAVEAADLHGCLPPPPAPGARAGSPAGTDPARGPAGTPVDVFVTQCEVNGRHGTGVLLQRLFGDGERVVSIRTMDLYAGEQSFGRTRLLLPHGTSSRPEIFARVVEALGGLDVRRVLCVPYDRDGVRTALVLREVFDAPLCTWVMDDQNIEAHGVPDEPMRELLTRSHLRLAISPELRRAYEDKFRLSFALAPPVVPRAHLWVTPSAPDHALLAARTGLVIGNIWGERWLENLAALLSDSGVSLDWHSAAGTPWMNIDGERLARAGLIVKPHLPEQELVGKLRVSPFVVVPSGTFEGSDEHRFVARLSLPSRIPYVAATAGAPIVVLGHPETAAARFVLRHGLGVVVPYERQAFATAVEAICTPAAQARHRAAAAALAPVLSSEGVADWLWSSLAAGRPIDDRFARLEMQE